MKQRMRERCSLSRFPPMEAIEVSEKGENQLVQGRIDVYTFSATAPTNSRHQIPSREGVVLNGWN